VGGPTTVVFMKKTLSGRLSNYLGYR
jgi:hypothetical protein